MPVMEEEEEEEEGEEDTVHGSETFDFFFRPTQPTNQSSSTLYSPEICCMALESCALVLSLINSSFCVLRMW